MGKENGKNYAMVKEALLERYNLTESAYKQKFRESKPQYEDTPARYLERIEQYLTKWIELSKTEKTYEGIKELFVVEQFLQTCQKELCVFLQENNAKPIEQITSHATYFINARNGKLISKDLTVINKRRIYEKEEKAHSNNQERKISYGRYDKNYNEIRGRNNRCYICNNEGHIAKYCKLNKRDTYNYKKYDETRLMKEDIAVKTIKINLEAMWRYQ